MGCSRREVGGGRAIPPNYCYGSNHGLAQHVHRQDVAGMQTVTSLEHNTHVHALATPITHTHVDRHASILTLNFCCCSSLIRMLSMIMSILTGGQRRQQVAPQQLTESIANECLSFLQQHLQRLYLIQIPPTYLSQLTASIKSLTPHIKAINHLAPVLFRPR